MSTQTNASDELLKKLLDESDKAYVAEVKRQEKERAKLGLESDADTPRIDRQLPNAEGPVAASGFSK